MSSIAAFIGRLLLSALFILQGAGKILYQQAYNESYANNPHLDWLVTSGAIALPLGLFELTLGVLILLGFFTRLTALAAGIYAILTGVYLHLANVAEPLHQQLLLMWLAVAGGLFLLFAYGHTRGSLDYARRRNATLADERDLERERALANERALRERPAVVARETVVERDPVTGKETIVDTGIDTVRVRERSFWDKLTGR